MRASEDEIGIVDDEVGGLAFTYRLADQGAVVVLYPGEEHLAVAALELGEVRKPPLVRTRGGGIALQQMRCWRRARPIASLLLAMTFNFWGRSDSEVDPSLQGWVDDLRNAISHLESGSERNGVILAGTSMRAQLRCASVLTIRQSVRWAY